MSHSPSRPHPKTAGLDGWEHCSKHTMLSYSNPNMHGRVLANRGNAQEVTSLSFP